MDKAGARIGGRRRATTGCGGGNRSPEGAGTAERKASRFQPRFFLFKTRRDAASRGAVAHAATWSSLDPGVTVGPDSPPVASRRKRSVSSEDVVRLTAAATSGQRPRTRATVSFEASSLKEELEHMAAQDGGRAGQLASSSSSVGHPSRTRTEQRKVANRLARSTSCGHMQHELDDAGPLSSSSPSASSSSSSSSSPSRNCTRQPPPLQHHVPPRREDDDVRPREARRDMVEVRGDQPQRVRRRNQVINEIINTERDYLQDLDTMVTLFRNPMLVENVLTREEITVMFSNVHLLIEVNRMLLADMVKRARETEGAELGDSFLRLGDYLKMYATYCGNHSAAIELVAKCQHHNARFRAHLARVLALNQTNRLTLKDFLIKPVQRICKYPLLLRELLNYTDADHPDFDKLKSANTKIVAVVANVNETQQREQEVEVMAKVISNLKIDTNRLGSVQLMVPSRQYHQEGTLLAASKATSEFLPQHYFLFSDLLLLTESPLSPKGGNGKKNKAAKLEVLDIVDFSKARVNLNHDDQRNSIEVETDDALYVLPFASSDHKRKWIRSHARTAHRPVM